MVNREHTLMWTQRTLNVLYKLYQVFTGAVKH